ncbi:MAG: hypothetical protein K2P58_13470 [Hyphomonadaceae bacterium]|nr:hypothetical protein [Hyphomonadaceae bacterium]
MQASDVLSESGKNLQDLASKPWQSDTLAPPEEIFAAKGMIGPEERRCYFWLGKNWLSGQGCIVDAGAFVGASTLCFASGAATGGRRDFKGEPLVHAYDYFKVVDKYVGESISRDFHPIEEGESYLEIFAAQVGPYIDMIRAYPGDFLTHRWRGLPIEILFIDIAKTAELCAHAIREFFPCLIPGRSVVVHQDYFHCWHPYIHVGMQYLDDEFTLVDELVPYQSRVWRLAKPIPADKIARLAAYDFSMDDRIALLDRLIESSSPTSRPMNEVVRFWQMCLDGSREQAMREFERLDGVYGFKNRYELWARQALQVRATLTSDDRGESYG